MSAASTGKASPSAGTGQPVDGPAVLAAFFEAQCGLAPGDAAALAANCVLRSHDAGDVLVVEGSPASAVHWLVSGHAAVHREAAGEGPLQVAELKPGAVFGEIAFLQDDPDAVYSATVVARHADTRTASIGYARLRTLPQLQEVRRTLTRQFGRIAAARLSATTAFATEALSAALARERRLARHLSIVIMVMAAFVVLSNSRLDLARALVGDRMSVVAFTSAFYFAIVLALGALFAWLVRGLGVPPAALGLQLADWRRQIRAGLLWSLPGLAAAAALRAWLHPDEPVLSPYAMDAGAGLLSFPGMLLLLGYVLVLCPVQEYVTRAGVQAPILNAFGASRARAGAIVSTLVAAVTFGAMHVAYGVGPVLLTTAVGIYWGIAFVRTRSVVAITVSHVVLGVAAFYWFGLIR